MVKEIKETKVVEQPKQIPLNEATIEQLQAEAYRTLAQIKNLQRHLANVEQVMADKLQGETQ